jgi:6-phosphogluconolactonase (cycloisomerase 2 family)
MKISIVRVPVLLASLLVLAACGGGGGSSSGSGGGSGAPPSYIVGGSISGLSGSGLVLQNSGANNLAVAASGNFTFTTALNSGGAYAVTVLTQPTNPAQTCSVSNGSGTVGSASVTNVTIACTTNTYSIGGSVSGLTGTGLVLQNNGGNNLPVAANGNFTFSAAIASGADYSVSVSTQPTGQFCAVTNAAGTVSTAGVSNVTVSCHTPVGKFVYLTNFASNSISAYSIDASSGALTAIGTPVQAGVAPSFVAADPSEKFLYVMNNGSASATPSISAYTINSTTGMLTPITGSPFPFSVSTPPPMGLTTFSPPAFDRASKFGFVGSPTVNKLYGALIDASTGGLTEIAGMPLSLGSLTGYPTFDATGKYLYVPYNDVVSGILTGFVAAFHVNATTGVLTPIGSPVPTGSSVGLLAQRDISGKFLLVSNQAASGGSISVFAIDSITGTLTSVAGSPFSTGAPARILSYHPTKNFIFVLTSINLTTNGSIVIFQLDTTTGVLTPTGAPNMTVGPGSTIPGVEPTGKFLIISNAGSNTIQSFSIDQTTGALTEVAGSPLATQQTPGGVRPDPSWKYFYSSNVGASTVSSYSLSATTGAMALINSQPTGGSPGYPLVVGSQ